MVMNASHTGEMTRDELYECYQLFRYKDVAMYNVDGIFSLLDSDNSGKVDFYEIFVAIVDPLLFLEKDHILLAFKAFDLDGGGSVSVDEMQ